MNRFVHTAYRLFCVAGLIVFAFSAFGQKEEIDTSGFEGFKAPKSADRENVIKTNALPLLFGQIPLCGEIRLTYERMLAHNQSITLGLSYNYPSLFLLMFSGGNGPFGLRIGGLSIRGGRMTLGYRFYPLKNVKAPAGLFLGPYFSYNFAKIKERGVSNGNYLIINQANASLIVGYQVKMSEHFFFEVFSGLGYRRNFIIEYEASTKRTTTQDFYFVPFMKNVKIVTQINFGYAF